MNSITIDSSSCKSTLCRLCAQSGTDKTPYNLHGHRHPYTAPYSLFFEPIRTNPIKFAELGVFRGASLCAWRSFFPHATLFGFDNDRPNLEFIASLQLSNTILDVIDASKKESIVEIFQKYTTDGQLFDVILDDASHDPNDQCMVIRSALPFLKPGGLLIVEDIFRDRPTDVFETVLGEMNDHIRFHTFLVCEHALRYSPGWNNDKLLVIVKA